MKAYDIKQFFHDSIEKSFIADAAELARCGEALFDSPSIDSPTRGLTIKSAGGQTADFLIQRVERSAEREILFWLLTPTTASVERQPELLDYTVTIYND
jgi:hypothetical protein